jgi:phage nucleotide-binding protein
MAIQLKSTKDAALNGVKITVYGQAGAGKTSLAATTDGPTIILSAEAGLLSLRGHDIPVIEVKTIDDVGEAYQYLSQSKEGQQFQWIVLDSISEVAEVVLANEKRSAKDPRQAYGALQDRMYEMIRAFRDLPGRNVYFSAKMASEKIDIVETRTSGALTTNAVVGTRMAYGPSLPGTKLGQALPYFTDLIFAMRVEKDQDGNPSRWLQTQPDDNYVAKDRSGVLDPYELPNLAAIAAKIRSTSVNTGDTK